MSGALPLPQESDVAVRVISQGPFSVGQRVWRDARGRLTCTIVAKATYKLVAGESAILDTPCSIQEEDAHWDDDRSKSVRVPGDLAPFKRTAEVVVVGSAFAAQKAPSIVARVRVGRVDKAVEVFAPRSFKADGSIEVGAPIQRCPIRYEHAAGGPDTDNPVGVDVTRPDERGRFPVPQLLPPACMLGAPGSPLPTCGLGPVASTWPSRAGLLGSRDRAWLKQKTAASMPAAFPPNYFQDAPPDQWLDRPISAKEAIVLEGLCADTGRLAMSLSGVEPRAVVVGPSPEVVRLFGDTLFVDTDRGVCTLTFRGYVPMEAAGARVLVAAVSAASELSPEDIRRIVAADRQDSTESAQIKSEGARPASIPAPPPLVRVPPPAPPPFLGTPPQTPVYLGAPSAAPTPVSTPISASAAPVPVSAPVSVPVPASSPTPAHGVVPAPTFMQSAPPVIGSAPGAAKSHRLPAASFDAAFGGVKAASDAALKVAAAPAPPETPRDRPAFSDAFGARGATHQRQAVVSLLSFDAAIVPRLKRAKRFTAVFDAKSRPKRAQGVDTPHQEPRDDRGDVLRALSFGQSADAAEIRRALGDSLDDLEELDPPILLVAGELRPTFDEVEVLRATVAVVKQVALGDKKILTALTVGQEALGAPITPRAETALGLVRQIEQAASSLPLPPRYVAAEVERLLVEGRKYKVRTVLGAARVRAEITLSRGGETMPLYLPETTATSLPLLVAFPVVALCEVLPREDLTDSQDEALLAVALGRVLRSR